MSIVKSFSVGNGDTFYIKHNSSNFTAIDCYLSDDNKGDILDELIDQSSGIDITRFISTHPDEDHIQGLVDYDEKMDIRNFYCVKNEATKADESVSFDRYCELRDSDKAFYIYKGCSRKWMNSGDDDRGSSGISILWPDTNNSFFKEELTKVTDGESPNNISPIIQYSVEKSASILWMGDLETDFMEKILDEVSLSTCNVLFAPHHGRKSGRVPDEWLEKIDPDVIIIGEAKATNLDYAGYGNYNKITQNSAGNIILENLEFEIDIYVSNEGYSVDFLSDKRKGNKHGCYYLGTIDVD